MHRARVLLAMIAVAVAIAACGPRAATSTPDFGPSPAEPVDPIACPAPRLERFAAAAETAITITTEPVVDAARIDKVPCKTEETDPQCIARARKRPAPSYYEVMGVTIGGDDAHVVFTYDLDGRRITEEAESMQQMVARLKAFQAQGRKVVLIRGESASAAGARHAAVAYRGVGGQERRIATLHWRPTKQDTDIPAARSRAMANIQARAAQDHIEIRSMQATDDTSLVVVVTCGAGV